MKNTLIFILEGLLILITCADANSAQSVGYCGEALTQSSHGHASESKFYSTIKAASKSNTALLNSFASQVQLSSADQLLINKIKSFPPYIVRHQPSKYFCEVLNNSGITAFGANIPQVEKNLYTAGSCIFVSIESPLGQPEWGDVLMTFDPESLTHIWVTPHSGYYYVNLYRLGFLSVRVNSTPEISLSEKQFFKQFIYTDKAQWQRIMTDAFRLRYKSLPMSDQITIRDKLMAINNRYDFQLTMAELNYQYKLDYYLEGHVNKFIPIKDIQSIQVPKAAESMLEANCPEALHRWRSLITFN